MNSETLVSASIQGGALALVVWLVVLAMPAMPPKAKVWLWRAVFVKFGLGFVGIGMIPLHVLPAPEPLVLRKSTMDWAMPASVETTGQMQLTQNIPLPAPPQPTGPSPLAVAWISGVLVLFGVGAVNVLRMQLMVKRAQPVADEWIIDELDELVWMENMRKAPRLLASPEAKSAFLAFGIRPAIVLPSNLCAESNERQDDLRLMLAHEVAHLAHRDLVWNMIAALVKGVFFFHPMIWLSSFRAGIAQETAADQRAVEMTGTSLKHYGEMLLRATLAGEALRSMPGAVAVAGSVRSLKERLDAMGRFSQRPPLALRAVAFAAIALMLPGYCLVAKAQEPAKAKKDEPTILKTPDGVVFIATEGNARSQDSKARHKTPQAWSRKTTLRGGTVKYEIEVGKKPKGSGWTEVKGTAWFETTNSKGQTQGDGWFYYSTKSTSKGSPLKLGSPQVVELKSVPGSRWKVADGAPVIVPSPAQKAEGGEWKLEKSGDGPEVWVKTIKGSDGKVWKIYRSGSGPLPGKGPKFNYEIRTDSTGTGNTVIVTEPAGAPGATVQYYKVKSGEVIAPLPAQKTDGSAPGGQVVTIPSQPTVAGMPQQVEIVVQGKPMKVDVTHVKFESKPVKLQLAPIVVQGKPVRLDVKNRIELVPAKIDGKTIKLNVTTVKGKPAKLQLLPITIDQTVRLNLKPVKAESKPIKVESKPVKVDVTTKVKVNEKKGLGKGG